MNDRCYRCHTILTSEDKYHYGANCNQCECDIEWENHERHDPIKSAYWRWRAICYCLRVLRHYPGKLAGLLLHSLRGNADA